MHPTTSYVTPLAKLEVRGATIITVSLIQDECDYARCLVFISDLTCTKQSLLEILRVPYTRFFEDRVILVKFLYDPCMLKLIKNSGTIQVFMEGVAMITSVASIFSNKS